MTVTSVEKDPQALTMTITAHYDAPRQRVWQIWADPRQLERWWGPPTYPATVSTHELTPGGRVAYSMTGPEGDTHHGYWEVTTVQPPESLEFLDGFSDAAGVPNPDMPTNITRVALTEEPDGRTRMRIETVFPDVETMHKLMEMGMEEGMTLAMGQIDGVLAGQPV